MTPDSTTSSLSSSVNSTGVGLIGIGRILMARGRDATDVAIVTSFGPCTLASFKVITQEVTSAVSASP